MPAVKLLSSPAIYLGDDRAIPPRGKTSALLYYLAYQADWVQRDDLLYLFWPDVEEQKARSNLRQLLSSLRSSSFGKNLKTNKQHVGWFVTTDVQQFKEALEQKNWLAAIEQYKGELLQGFRSTNIPEFESWLQFERIDLFRLYRKTVLSFSHELELKNQLNQAIGLVERLYRFDLLDEEVFRYYLELLILCGKLKDAREAYKQFTQLLTELDAKPETATVQLIEQVHSSNTNRQVKRSSLSQITVSPSLKIPTPATQFVGREVELNQIMALLRDPACRLLTIVAAGGMGKTRLTIEVAHRLKDTFNDGICFVPFEPVSSAELMVSAIAAALKLSFLGPQDPKEQLFNYLKHKHLLLVADNLEHLVARSQLFSELLEAAPDLSILASSRVNLNLHAEWLFDLTGMSLQQEDMQTNDATRLFEQSAKKVRASFKLENNQEAVRSICEQTGGMPLAIELSASWLRVLTAQEIAIDLSKDVNLLAGSIKDMPKRHQDIQGVFETSWQRLKREEQTALLGLSVFYGGFNKNSAKDIAEINPLLLLGLSNKSFLSKDDAGRFTQHPLLWQYIRKKAENDPSFARLQEKHATYFSLFLKAHEAGQEGLESLKIRQEISTELANILAAWNWIVEQNREDLLEQALWSLCEYYRGENRFQEGEALFSTTVAQLSKQSLIRGRLLHRLGIFNNLLGNYDRSADFLRESLRISKEHKSLSDEAHALFVWGVNLYFKKTLSVEKHAEIFSKAAHMFRQLGDRYHEARALGNLGSNTKDLLEREKLIRQAISMFRETQGYFGLTQQLGNLAMKIEAKKGNFKEAEAILEEAIFIEQKRYNPYRLIWWLTEHGHVLSYQGKFEKAEHSFKEALKLSEQYNIDRGVTSPSDALYGLGCLAVIQQDYQEAESHFKKVYELSKKNNKLVPLVNTLNGLCKLALAKKQLNKAADLCKQIEEVLETLHLYRPFREELDFEYLKNLADLQIVQNNIDTAKQTLLKAFKITKINFHKVMQLELLVSYCSCLETQENSEEASTILSFIVNHKSSTFATREAAQKQLRSYSKDEKVKALELAKKVTLERLVEDLMLKG